MAGRTYDEIIATRCTKRQRRAMERKAKAAGLEFGTWLRVVALAACGETKLASELGRAIKAGSKKRGAA